MTEPTADPTATTSEAPAPFSGAFPAPRAPEEVAAERAAKARRLNRLRAGLVGVSVLAGAGWFGYQYLQDQPVRAKVGDCVAGRTGDDVHVVSCTGGGATFKVVAKQSGLTRVDAGVTACRSEQDATTVFWQGSGDADAKGDVLCLAPLK
jgi:hypothetical protein